tara:strand:- start:161 stop:268 length:108 start_codon:yes stop_codon:yes gene_type:complete
VNVAGYPNSGEVMGVNSQAELAQVERHFHTRQAFG